MSSKNKIITITNNIALKLAKKNVNSTCFWIYHQPEIPESVRKLKKK